MQLPLYAILGENREIPSPFPPPQTGSRHVKVTLNGTTGRIVQFSEQLAVFRDRS
jgi:hypothetical protein